MPKDKPMDALNNAQREVVYRSKNTDLFKRLAETTSFKRNEVKSLALIHRKIVMVRKPVNRLVFRDILHGGLDFTENIRHLLVDRVFSRFDKRNALQISAEQWVSGFSTYLRGSTEEQARFAYSVYDLMRTNKITKEQMFPILRGCFIRLAPEEDPDETVNDMIDLLVKVIDIDRDGDVSGEEFETVVLQKNPLFMECLGPVFPSREARHAFLTTFTDYKLNF